MRVKSKLFQNRYNSIIKMDGKDSDLMMDFGMLKMYKGQQEVNRDNKERAYLLIQGEVIFTWGKQRAKVRRRSCFDENPSCLHIPASIKIRIVALKNSTEIAVLKTNNEKSFLSKIYLPEECRSEERGKGTAKEASTRIVRTVFDKKNTGCANLVLGEVINFPGRWSSYPPHFHSQPEIYYYKFYPESGFGFAEVGENIYKVKNNDTLKIIPGCSHPQVSAPGYTMYYLWAIRHLDNEPYISPTFMPEHLWITKKNAKVWPDK